MRAVLTVFLAATSLFVFNLRGSLPSFGGYVTRLKWLEGLPSSIDVMNCAGYISNAHGGQRLDSNQFYRGEGQTHIVAEYRTPSDVRESDLLPGDVIAFHGFHVAAYLGNGRWVDSDARRGDISEFRLTEKSKRDDWFSGPVRIVRWNDTETSDSNTYARQFKSQEHGEQTR
jgi:hypothetical protein